MDMCLDANTAENVVFPGENATCMHVIDMIMCVGCKQKDYFFYTWYGKVPRISAIMNLMFILLYLQFRAAVIFFFH